MNIITKKELQLTKEEARAFELAGIALEELCQSRQSCVNCPFETDCIVDNSASFMNLLNRMLED